MFKLDSNYPVIAAAVITLLFLWWYIRYDILLLGRIKKTLKEAGMRISSLSSEEDNIDKIDRIFSDISNESLKKIWDTYYNRTDREDISETFNAYDTIILPSAKKRSEAIPAVLVTLGILAVFGGLVIGMGNMPEDAVPSALAGYPARTASGALAAGMAGVVFSILFQLLDRSHYQSALTQLRVFCYTANTKLLYRDIKEVQSKNGMEELLIKVEQEFRNGSVKTSDAIQALTAQIKSFTAEFGDKLANMQSEGLKGMIHAFLEQLSSSTGEYLKELEVSYEKLSQAQKQSAEVINTLLEAAGTYSEHQSIINKASEDAVKKVLICTDKITENTQFTAEAAEKTKEFAAVLTDLMQNAEQNEQDTASKFSEIINNMLQKLDSGLNNNIDRLGEASSKLLEELDNRVFSINVYTDVISKEISGLSGNLNTSVETFGSQMNSCIQKSFETFDSSVADICDRLGTTAAAIRDAVDELPKVLSGYKYDDKGVQVGPDER